jgi:predicted Zn-dependent peptidase
MRPKLTTLKNGLRILTVTLPEAQTVTVMHLVAVGSKYEKDNERGLSHFLEHMCFKGTSTYDSPKKLALALDEKGTESNAFTSYEYTGYYAKGGSQHSMFYIDAKKEKGVILEEIKMSADLPMRVVQHDSMELLYGDQPAGRSILGVPHTVTSFTHTDFKTYHKKYYQPNNSLVVVVGNDTHAAVVKKIKTIFEKLPNTPVPKKQKVRDTQSEPLFHYRERTVDQMHVVLSFRGFPIGHPDAPAAEVLASVLGKGMSSRLFSKVREELGGAYYIRAEHDTLTDHGIFSVLSGIDTLRAPLILSEIATLLKEVKQIPVSKHELKKAKEILISGIQMGLETTDAIAGYYGGLAILGQPLKTPEALIRDIQKVTAEDLMRVAKKLFVPKKGSLAIVGPKKDEGLKKAFFDCL